MDGISPVSAYGMSRPAALPAKPPADPAVGMPTAAPAANLTAGTPAAAQAGAAAGETNVAGVQAGTASVSVTAMQASSEMLMVSQNSTPAVISEELLGAILLYLLMEYMRTQDEEKQKELMGLMGAVVGLAQGGQQQSSTMIYSASSLSMESMQMQVGTAGAIDAYAGQAATNVGVAGAHGSDSAAPRLDITA